MYRNEYAFFLIDAVFVLLTLDDGLKYALHHIFSFFVLIPSGWLGHCDILLAPLLFWGEISNPLFQLNYLIEKLHVIAPWSQHVYFALVRQRLTHPLYVGLFLFARFVAGPLLWIWLVYQSLRNPNRARAPIWMRLLWIVLSAAVIIATMDHGLTLTPHMAVPDFTVLV